MCTYCKFRASVLYRVLSMHKNVTQELCHVLMGSAGGNQKMKMCCFESDGQNIETTTYHYFTELCYQQLG